MRERFQMKNENDQRLELSVVHPGDLIIDHYYASCSIVVHTISADIVCTLSLSCRDRATNFNLKMRPTLSKRERCDVIVRAK